MSFVQINITWYQTEGEYWKIRLWFSWNIIYIEYIVPFLGTFFDIRMIFERIFEITHSITLYKKMYKQNRTITI